MGKTSNDKNNVGQVYTLKINCLPEETANLEATTSFGPISLPWETSPG